jgi:hypothetical protein
MTDAQVEAACATLKLAIEAAENANQAGEDFVMAAAAGPALLEAVRLFLAYDRGDEKNGIELMANYNAALVAARAAYAKATGEPAQ